MLDLAMDLTDTSRLGCQIKVTKELEGMRATVPGGARGAASCGAALLCACSTSSSHSACVYYSLV